MYILPDYIYHFFALYLGGLSQSICLKPTKTNGLQIVTSVLLSG